MSNEKLFSPVIVWSEKAESSCENSAIESVREHVVELNAYRQKKEHQVQSNQSCITYEGIVSYLDLTIDSGRPEDENEAATIPVPLVGQRIRVVKVSSGFGKLSKEWTNGDIYSQAA